jgi:hypothetical protein
MARLGFACGLITTDLDTKLLIASAISLMWLVCLLICILKGKYGVAIVGFVAAVAQEIGLPPVGGYYILNLLYPLWLLPIYGAMRLAHPKSYYAYWFYRHNLPKYFRSVQRFGLEEEYADLVARQTQHAAKEEQRKQETCGQTNDHFKIQEIIREGPERIGATIDACCEDPNQRVFAQALLDNALEDYFLLQLAMFANTKVNAYVTITRWKNAGLKLPAEGTAEFFPH